MNDFVNWEVGSKLKESAIPTVFTNWPTYLQAGSKSSTPRRSLKRKACDVDETFEMLPVEFDADSNVNVPEARLIL